MVCTWFSVTFWFVFVIHSLFFGDFMDRKANPRLYDEIQDTEGLSTVSVDVIITSLILWWLTSSTQYQTHLGLELIKTLFFAYFFICCSVFIYLLNTKTNLKRRFRRYNFCSELSHVTCLPLSHQSSSSILHVHAGLCGGNRKQVVGLL